MLHIATGVNSEKKYIFMSMYLPRKSQNVWGKIGKNFKKEMKNVLL